MAHGKHRKRKRGVHKGRHSPETKRWEREHLIPRKPAWMDVQTYTQLAERRNDAA